MTPEQARRLALSFEGAVERDHHGFPSFRTARRIFATLPDQDTLRVMLDEQEIRAAVAEWGWCTETWWGRRLAAVAVALPECDPDVVAELLEDAYRRGR